MDALKGEFDTAWADFQTLDDLRLVAETLEAEWSRGRDTYLAFLVPIVDASVSAHLRKLVRAVEDTPGVEPYPEDYWHIRIARFTSKDGISQLKETVGRLREESPGPSFSVNEVRLVRAHLSERTPILETMETYRLRQSAL